jgi:hypothetical protein
VIGNDKNKQTRTEQETGFYMCAQHRLTALAPLFPIQASPLPNKTRWRRQGLLQEEPLTTISVQ